MKRTTSQKSHDEQRHFKQHTHSVITTYRRFFEDEPAYFSIRKQNRSCCSNISPQPRSFLPKSRIAAPLPGRTSWVMKTINSENRSQDVQPVCFWYKNANIQVITFTVRARAILTNHGLRLCPWDFHVQLREGRERTPRSSTQSSRRLPGQEQGNATPFSSPVSRLRPVSFALFIAPILNCSLVPGWNSRVPGAYDLLRRTKISAATVLDWPGRVEAHVTSRFGDATAFQTA